MVKVNALMTGEKFMALHAELSKDGKCLTIHISGKFDFTLVQGFRQAYSELSDNVEQVVVDLKDTEYMDSSALGMLLNMKKTLGDRVKSIRLSGCQPQIRKILQISRFDKKFEID